MNKKKNIKSKGKTVKAKSDINVPNAIRPTRIISVLIVIVIIMVALLGRVFYLQIIDGEHLQTLATSQQTLTETISAKRGTIYASNGTVLAISYDTDKVYINPSEIEKIGLYELTSDDELLEKSIEELICETCFLADACDGVCIVKRSEKNKIQKEFFKLLKNDNKAE